MMNKRGFLPFYHYNLKYKKNKNLCNTFHDTDWSQYHVRDKYRISRDMGEAKKTSVSRVNLRFNRGNDRRVGCPGLGRLKCGE